ncbi:MAG: glycine cleavage system protein GcvH [Sphaerospermopsis sp. SIO1G2]|nr:glycine cleavage system protein GcvH [Sphaerospermopsis sp. SIO1G1]NET73953.1 glycine cleavage system protein GcvH [Sphaerospermopsis sp. SIO1G2]
MDLEYPQELKYQDSHEYVRLDEEVATIGITAYAVEQLGDIVFLDLPSLDEAITKGDSFGTVESVKAVEELKAPLSGTVIEVNEKIVDAPEQLADDPYQDGWLIKVRPDNAEEIDDDLMSAEEYREQVEGEN